MCSKPLIFSALSVADKKEATSLQKLHEHFISDSAALEPLENTLALLKVNRK
jgi:hypothetical protein